MTLSWQRAAGRVPLRISYLFPQFPVPTEVFAVSDIVALRNLGHEVVVYTIKPRRRDEERRLRQAGVPENLSIRRPSLPGALRWPGLLWTHRRQVVGLIRQIVARGASTPSTAATALLSIPRIVEIADEIERHDADIAHVFWSRHAGMTLAVLAGTGSPVMRSAFAGAYDLVADDFLVDLTLAWSEIVFTHAETNKDYLEARVPKGRPVKIIHRGIPLIARDDTIVRDPRLWLTASALTSAKNVEGVLRAFSEARGKQLAHKLEICGDGPDRARLEQIARELGCREVVEFKGHVEREELFRHMQRASLFLLLSKKPTERLPNVIKEALWAGCAVISSPTAGIEALLPDSRLGRIVNPDDAGAVVRAATSVLSEADEQVRERGRSLISKHFSSDRSMRRYVRAWQALLATHEIVCLRDA